MCDDRAIRFEDTNINVRYFPQHYVLDITIGDRPTQEVFLRPEQAADLVRRLSAALPEARRR